MLLLKRFNPDVILTKITPTPLQVLLCHKYIYLYQSRFVLLDSLYINVPSIYNGNSGCIESYRPPLMRKDTTDERKYIYDILLIPILGFVRKCMFKKE